MSTVLVEVHEHVMLVTLNRPEAMNAVNADLSTGVGEALERAEADAEIRVLVITGAGDRAFCAGADLKAIARGESIHAPHGQQWGFAGYARHAISKPTIAAVNGFALGGGTELVLASDMAIAADTASLGLPEVARGLFAAAGGAFRLPEQIPRKIAMELLLTGNPISAERAAATGLVNRVVAADQLLGTALELAERISAKAPLAVQASKRVALGIANHAIAAEEGRWELNDREIRALRLTDDMREGSRAFAEKRRPQWQAR